MSLPGYDNWKLHDGTTKESEAFADWFENKEDKLRRDYEEYLVADGVLDDDLADYDEDKFQEWAFNRFKETEK